MTTTAAPPAREAPAMDAFREDRTYLGADHRRNERRTWIVTVICAATLAIQVAGGVAFGSMALTASGLHMAAHVAVLLVAAGAYAFARRHADDPRFAFGTGKIGYLAGFANAVVLAITALLIGIESVQRILKPEETDFASALPLAVGGLAVNLVCVWLLRPTHLHEARGDREGDLNLSAAHLHLSADAAVSVLAIAGLAAGQVLGWRFADPAAGLVGAVLVAQFAVSLVRRAAAALLDMNPSAELTAEIRTRLSAEGESVVDLHLWRLGPGHHAAVAVVAADPPQEAEAYHRRLRGLPGLSHVTVEVRSGDPSHPHPHSHV